MRLVPASANAWIAVLAIIGLPVDALAQADSPPRVRAGQTVLVPYQPPPAEPTHTRSQWQALARTQAAQAPSHSWYGYQIMLTDAAFIGMGIAAQRAEVTLAGCLGAPILVHAVHRRPVLAVASPIVRVVLPLLGFAIGSIDTRCNAHGDECGMGGMIYGTGIGMAAALILDWSWSWSEPVTPAPTAQSHALEDGAERSPSKPSGLAMTTAVVPSSKGVSFVLGGQF